MRRGDLVIVSAPGDYGKPRPAVIVQNDRLQAISPSVVVCFLTTELATGHRFRIDISPNEVNGLRELSQVQIEKVLTFPNEKIRGPIGRLEGEQMRAIDRGLILLLDLLPPLEISRVT